MAATPQPGDGHYLIVFTTAGLDLKRVETVDGWVTQP
jgi:hypothetical protein